MQSTNNVRVVIVGAGFGGLWAARHLARKPGVTVTLIDKNNYHTFLPLLYQVAAAELEPEQIAYPIRGIFRGTPNVQTVLGEVDVIDLENRVVATKEHDYPYDQLIIATGSDTAYFGVPGAKERAFTLKSLEDAVRLRNRLLTCFEQAAQMTPETRPEGMLRVAVVGGGATGVEYAGALMELMKTPLAKDFPEFSRHNLDVILVDGGNNPLGGFPEKLRAYTARQLETMGVKVQLGAAVVEVTDTGLMLKDGTFVAAHTVVWAAGVCGSEAARNLGIPVGRGGRLEVLPTLQAAGHDEVQVIGDLALVEGLSAPMVAPNAVQQGKHAAENILKMIRHEPAEVFRYKDKGAMVTIGRSAAVARIGTWSFTGFFAWVVWLMVHLTFLIGFRNRLLVMINWAWDYLFFERAVRIILPRDPSASCMCQEERKE